MCEWHKASLRLELMHLVTFHHYCHVIIHKYEHLQYVHVYLSRNVLSIFSENTAAQEHLAEHKHQHINIITEETNHIYKSNSTKLSINHL